MNERRNGEVEGAAPLEGVGEGVENEGGRTETERETRVEVEFAEPMEA